jgi:hypothetical protein
MKLKRLVEGIGANSMELDNAERILRPDIKRANAMMFYAGASGTVPSHWNNSPFLTGGRLTSAFGANPRLDKKNKVLSYQEFVAASNEFNKTK